MNREHARKAKDLSWRALAIALAFLSALETLAGASVALIVLGEILHLWDLL